MLWMVLLWALPVIAMGQVRTVKVVVDERMEMLALIGRLGNVNGLSRTDTRYGREADSFFAPYRKHPAVSLVRTLYQNEVYNGSALPWYLLQFTFPAFKADGIILQAENQLGSFEAHQDTINLFRERLRDFYTKTGFHEFFESHREFYDSLCAPVGRYMNESGFAGRLATHFGTTKSRYTVILSLLSGAGGTGFQVHRKTGDEAICVAGPTGSADDQPFFEPTDLLKDAVLHEFCHTFCDGVIQRSFETLAADSCLIDTIASVNESVRRDLSGDWESCLAEHWVRANEVVLCRKLFGDQVADKKLEQYYYREHWLLLEGLVPLIENTPLRGSYKIQDDLMPLVASYLEEIRPEECR
jgi:hypothetical protein